MLDHNLRIRKKDDMMMNNLLRKQPNKIGNVEIWPMEKIGGERGKREGEKLAGNGDANLFKNCLESAAPS